MKYTLMVLALLAPLTAAASLGATEAEPEPNAFVQSVRELHRGPPVQQTRNIANVETRWFTLKLDNFNAANNATWKDRVLINEDHFTAGSPIFIYLGGEWEIEPSSITSGLWVDIAKEHNGSLIYTEHRFFGKSFPITPLSTKNLKYQSVQQALADVVNIIKILKQEDKYKDSKVLVSGCSYSASMATWIRKLYPDVILGSWASSAPLLAKVDFAAYMEVVGQSFKQLGGQYCYDLINNATSYYQKLFESGRGAKAKKELNLCASFNAKSEHDRWQIFSTIANVFAGLAQYQKPGNYDLPRYCSVLRSFSDDDAEALSLFVQWQLGYPKCVSVSYQGTINYYKWAKNNYEDDTGLPWIYQTCSEFGWYQSSGSPNQPFGSSFPATLYTDTCHDAFSPNYTLNHIEANTAATNAEFRGIDIDVNNVYWTQGGLDPWSKVGAGEAQGATIIPQASHCSDLGSISLNDSPVLMASKLKLKQLVKDWLAQ
ncbi:thymus-specific serine protease [Drosophila guanche]|uniref:Blast:Thymus-specific serine protease n=1 Tax=Drosophila guanche TaxID=7266 RepID=A0A3B0KFC9_DROGU|nr:thymus-specific serine protease [Drosophila guanche]SPP83761.1 blast:Thymus-specific serine protease [Drosophila guanche]